MPPSTQAHSQPRSANEYWKKAYDSLDDYVRLTIGTASTDKNDVLAAVLQTAEQKREICIRKRWKVKLPGGKIIIIRDVVEKIAQWVKMYAPVGDVAVNFNPSTAALPWAAVRFILQVAINETEVHGSIMSELETISRLISTSREFERIHLQRASSPLKQDIEDAITRLYADILNYLAMTMKYFDTNSFGEKNSLLRYTSPSI